VRTARYVGGQKLAGFGMGPGVFRTTSQGDKVIEIKIIIIPNQNLIMSQNSWRTKFYNGITSEKYVRNVMRAYLQGHQTLNWIGSMLEFWSSTEELIKNPEKRKSELIRVIETYGNNQKSDILNEMKRRNLV